MSQPGFDQNQPPYPPQQQYPQQGYQNPGHHVVQQNNSAEYMQGQQYKEKSLIFGIVGFFFLGFIFGPLAIINANKAEAMNHSATAGKVLGWIDTIASILGFIVFIVIIFGGMAAAGSGY